MENQYTIKKDRNYGIDLLRIIAMFMVVILHILGTGGILEEAKTAKHLAISWFMECGAYCAVDCYALISGFVGFSDKVRVHKYSRWILLWIEVVFYSVCITLGFCLLSTELIDFKIVVRSLFPVTFKQNWYFTAYTGLFFFMPWLNILVRNTPKREMSNLIVWMIIIFSFYTTAVFIVSDPFYLIGGYSFLWLAVLYLVGAYVRKYQVYKTEKRKLLLLLMGSLFLFTWVWKLGIGSLSMKILGHEFGDKIFVQYTSPTILGIAIILLILFAQMNLNQHLEKWIKIIAPSVFGVFLIHVHPFVGEYLLKNRFGSIATLSAWKIPFVVLGLATIIFVIGVLIDKAREAIFKICRIEMLASVVEDLVRRVIKKIQKF